MGETRDELDRTNCIMGIESKTNGAPYTVCGVQYLPDKSRQRGDHFKRTLRRMSSKRRSKSDGNLKSRLGSKTGDKSLQNGHAHSSPDMEVSSGLEVDCETSEHSRSEVESDHLASPVSENGHVAFDLGDKDRDLLTLLPETCTQLNSDTTDSDAVNLSTVDWTKYRFPYENVVLSGGGSKGYAYIGALKALEDCGVLAHVTRVGGSSAGAICGGLLAVGCSPQEIADVFFCNIKWLFQDQPCGCCFCLPKILKSYGINPGIRFQEIYGSHIAKKVGNPDITFMELYRDYGREFCVVVTNLSRMCSEYCHWTTTPDLPIRMAVRMSMSFPVVYEPVKSNLFGAEHIYMDGGTLDQFPVHCFDGPLFELNHNFETGQKRCMNDKTIGISLVSESPIDHKIWHSQFGDQLPNGPSYIPHTKLAKTRLKDEIKRRKRVDKSFDAKKFVKELKSDTVTVDGRQMMKHFDLGSKQVNITSFSRYFKASLSTVIVSQRRLHVKPDDIHRTVAVNCGYIGTNDYDLEPADREFMIRCGYDHTKKFLLDFINHQKNGTGMQQQPNATCRTYSRPAMPRSVSSISQYSRGGGTVPRSVSMVSRTSRETQV